MTRKQTPLHHSKAYGKAIALAYEAYKKAIASAYEDG